MSGHTRAAKKIAMHLLLLCTYAPKMDGLLVVLRLKWVAWAMYPNLCYIVSNPSWSQAPHPVNFEMSAVVLPIGAIMSSFSEENALNGPPGQWVDPSALLLSPYADLSTRQVCRVSFDLCPILLLVSSRFKQPVAAPTSHDVRSLCGVRVHVASMGRHDHANPYCASVRMRFWIAVSSGAHAHLSNCGACSLVQLCACSLVQLCACSFVHELCACSLVSRCACCSPPVRTTLWFVGPSLCFDRLKEGCFWSCSAVCLWIFSYLSFQRVICAALISWTC